MDNTVSNLINALKNEFATNASKVYINSLGKDVYFRDISVNEQKSLAKILIDNEDNPHVEYSAQCALIQRLALDKDFDINNITEFDRIKIMFALYRSNFFTEPIPVKCPSCGEEFKVNIDVNDIIDRFDDVEVSDREFKTNHGNKQYVFSVNYPSVSRMIDYHSTKAKDKVKSAPIRRTNSISDTIDMFELFIKKISIYNMDTESVIEIDANTLSYKDYSEVIGVLPQDIIMNTKSPVIVFIKTLFEELSNKISKPKCPNCGIEQEGIFNLGGFFTF